MVPSSGSVTSCTSILGIDDKVVSDGSRLWDGTPAPRGELRRAALASAVRRAAMVVDGPVGGGASNGSATVSGGKRGLRCGSAGSTGEARAESTWPGRKAVGAAQADQAAAAERATMLVSFMVKDCLSTRLWLKCRKEW